MNKIYKLIWSKVRNCYVAVSEIAKGHGKGSFVHKGKAALALAVSLWMAGGVLLVPGLASAANSGGIKVGDTYRGDNGTLENNEIVYDTNVDGVVHVVGAYATDANQTATNNTVTIAGNADLSNGHVTGAYLHGVNDHADGNTVIINSGSTINDVYGGYALGGGSSTASNNTVTINGGTIKEMVAGGYFRNGGTAEGNTITLNGAKIKSVYGGYANDGTLTCSDNILNLSGENEVGRKVQNFKTINFENVTWGKPALKLTGTDPDYGITQNADGTYAAINTWSAVFSGDVPETGTTTLIESANALPEGLEVYTGATTKVALTTTGVVAGSYKVTDGSDDKFYKNLSTVALANENKAVVYNATDNHLSYTDKTDPANKAVTLYAQPSASDTDAGYTVAVNNYTLYLADGFKSLTVAGGDWDTLTELYAGYTTTGANLSGYSLSVTGTLNATEGITISGEKSAVAMAAVTDGSVKISDSVITVTSTNHKLMISGIENSNAGAARGSVTISGSRSNANSVPTTRLTGSSIDIYAANTGSNTYKSEQGNVSLSGDVGFKGTVSLYGRQNNATGTGNTLRIGTDGTNDAVWRGYTSTDGSTWTQTNAIGYVYNFDTIALHAVEFNADRPALKAGTLSYRSSGGSNDLRNVTLDLTNLSFVDGDGNAYTPTSGSMKLLDTATDLTGMKLAYNAATQATPVGLTEEGVVVKKDASPTESEANGVTLAYRNTHTVAFAADSKSITYNIANPVGDVALGTIDWVKDGTARTLTDAENALFTFNGTTAVNAENLTFRGTINENPLNQSMTLLAGATGVTGDHITPPGERKGEIAVAYTDAKNVKFDAKASGTVSVDSGAVKYTINSVALDKATLGSLAWGDTDSLPDSWKASGTTQIDDTNFAYTGAAGTALKAGNTATILTAPGLLATSPVTDGTVAGKTVDINYTDDAGVTYTATASGHVAAAKDAVNYVVDSVAATGVNLQSWNGKDASTVITANGWALAAGATIETDGMTVPKVEAGKHIDILQSDTDEFFANAKINGANVYKEASFTDNENGITLTGSQFKGVTLNSEKKHVIYAAGIKDVATVTLGSVTWQKGATLLDGSSTTGYDYTAVKALGTDGFDVSYTSPETVAAGDSMTLLKVNETLAGEIAADVEKTKAYSYTPVEGVTVDAAVTGKMSRSGHDVIFTATANQASKLTFGSVDWKDSGALMTRPSNITFAGADVDTTKIHFKNIKELDANKKMTLVSDFGDSVGTITGTKYTVGAGLEGEGAASLSGSDLIFTTKTGTNDLAAQEQTHNTLMVMEAGMAVLAAGNEHVGQAMAELGNTQNAAVDGTVTAASLGGSKSRYKTGSHVDSDSWNVAVAVGSKRELKKGSLEWGVFGEYGKSNYTLHSDAGRGDGDSHYAGGGLMAKWTNKHDVYTEASVRLGRLSDTANNLLRDAAGNSYGYDVHANYFGAHVGIGKIIRYKGGKSLDVYGKYFYTKRDGVDFTSGGNNYSLDSVASSILRVGARYGTTDKKWNWYGGLAYEYEFDGKSEGTVDGIGIRAASVKGGSVRGEIGLRMSATKTNPWQTDISIYGYGGKHRGFGGSVNVAYMF